jgi:hypothetical protein
MMDFDPEKEDCRVGSGSLEKKKITELSVCAYRMLDSLNRGRILFRFGGFSWAIEGVGV